MGAATTFDRLDYDRDYRDCPSRPAGVQGDPRVVPTAPAPAITLGLEIGLLHTALSMANDELSLLIDILVSVSRPERGPATVHDTATAEVPPAVGAVREARYRVEMLTVRMNEVRNRLALD